MKTKLNLPPWAWQYKSPRSTSKHDLYASFYGNSGDTICVGLELGEKEPGDEDNYYLTFDRSGISENRFSKGELAKVIELISIFGKEKKL